MKSSWKYLILALVLTIFIIAGYFTYKGNRFFKDTFGISLFQIEDMISDIHCYDIVDGQLQYEDEIVSEADPSSFKELDFCYGKDKNHVFADGKIITEADPKSFKPLNHSYAKDDNNVFCFSQGDPIIMQDVDVKSFKADYWDKFGKILLNDYDTARDKNSVYHDCQIVKNIENGDYTYKNLDGLYYFADKTRVYYDDIVLENSDAPTFEILSDCSS